MMTKIPIRKEPPSRLNEFGAPDERDETQEAIGGVRAAIEQAPADVFGVRMRKAVGDACDAATACNSLLKSIASDFFEQRKALDGVIAGAKQAVVATVPMSGHPSRQDYMTAVRTAEDSAERGIVQSVTASVLNARSDQATKIGNRFVTAMTALSTAIDVSYADATSPAGLRSGSDSSLDRISRLSMIERGLRAAERPALEIERTFASLVRAAENDKIRDLIEACAGSILAEIRSSTTKTGTGPRYSGGLAQDLGGEREIAFRLARAFADWQRSQVPRSLTIANDCFQDLCTIFRVLVGADVRLLSPGQFAMRHIDGRGAAPDAGRPFQLEADWTMRALPGARAAKGGA